MFGGHDTSSVGLIFALLLIGNDHGVQVSWYYKYLMLVITYLFVEQNI